MSPAEAAEAVKIEVQEINERVVQQMNAKLPMASNFLRNAEIDVLSGNPSPSAPGAVPGTVTGNLMRTWTPFYTSGGAAGVFGITSGANYAGYLEHGTYKMAARPYVDKMKETAMPGILSLFADIGG